MRKEIFIFILCLFMLPSALGVFAQEKIGSVQTCTDNTTLIKNQTWLFSNGTLQNLQVNEVCNFGCNEIIDVCRPAPLLELSVGFLIVLVFLLIIFKLTRR